MRDLLRLIAIGLLSFAVVGVAMVYSRGGDLSTAFTVMRDGVTSTASDIGTLLTGPVEDAADATTPATYAVSIARPHRSVWVGLAGFPDQAEVTFPLPRGTSYLSGALNLSFDAQLTEQGDGLLTLSVNGTPRGQVVLDKGRHTYQARVELTAADLAGDRVVLHMAGRGTTNAGQICPTDAANSGSAITLSPDSALELTSATAPADTASLMLAPADALALRPGSNDGDMALTIWAAQRLARAGIETRVGDAGSGETQVTMTSHAISLQGDVSGHVVSGRNAVLSLADATGSVLPLPEAWPVTVADLGAETIVKSFRGSRRWTVSFAAADLPNGALPEIFALRLKATPLAGSNDWVVRVTLNGNLIETRRLAGSSDSIAFDVPLPAGRMLPANALVVELVDTTPNEGICTRAPDAQAQLLPESALIDTAPAEAAWAQLIETLATAPVIGIGTRGTLGTAAAQRASDMLAQLLPRAANVIFDAPGAVTLQIATRDSATAANGAALAVLPVTTASGTALAVLPVDGAEFTAARDRLGPDDVIVLAITR